MKISILREKRIQKTVANIFKATTKLKTIWKQRSATIKKKYWNKPIQKLNKKKQTTNLILN
jgi:hypothetical protein